MSLPFWYRVIMSLVKTGCMLDLHAAMAWALHEQSALRAPLHRDGILEASGLVRHLHDCVMIEHGAAGIVLGNIFAWHL